MGVYDTFQQTKAKTGTSVFQQFQQSKVAPAQKQNLISRAANVVATPIKFMAGSIQSAFQNKAKTDLNLTRGITVETAKVWKDTVTDTSKRFNAAFDAWAKPGKNDKLDVAVKTAQAGLGIVNTLFAPITGVMKGLETNPIIGWPAAAVNGIFAGIGEGSSEAGLAGLDKMPFSDETKKKLEPLVSETFALAGMIAAGKGGEVAVTKLRANTNAILDTVKTDAPKISSPEPTKNLFTEYQEKTGKVVTEQKPSDYTTFKSETNLKLVDEARARGIVFDADIPVQTRMSMIENLKTAEEIVKTDPAKAERFLTREEPLPTNVEVGSIYKALKQKALQEGDAGLVERLSRTTVGTESARALKSFDEGVKLNADPVEALAEVRQARLNAAIGREKGLTIEKAVKDTKASVGKILKPDRATWADFIKSIEC